jgi:hypothetical protein
MLRGGDAERQQVDRRQDRRAEEEADRPPRALEPLFRRAEALLAEAAIGRAGLEPDLVVLVLLDQWLTSPRRPSRRPAST